MNDTLMNVTAALQGKSKVWLGRAGVLGLALGLSASGVASPTAKHGKQAKEAASTPKHTALKSSFLQSGVASWYGPGFNGRRTANGETYDMYAMTCAHRTLPLGTWIRVTNLHNLRSVFLRVNDRGPMSPRFIVDLSWTAAQKLGSSGLAKVKIEVVSARDARAATQMVAELPMSKDPSVLLPLSTEPGLTGLASIAELR